MAYGEKLMQLTVHKMHGCLLCNKCICLLKHWNIAYREVYDNPIHDRLYPYITIDYEYKELVDLIAKNKIS